LRYTKLGVRNALKEIEETVNFMDLESDTDIELTKIEVDAKEPTL